MKHLDGLFQKRYALAWFGMCVHLSLVGFMFFHFTTPNDPFNAPSLCFFSVLVVVPWIVFAKYSPPPGVHPAASRVWDVAGLTFLMLSSWIYWDLIFPKGRRDGQEMFAFITIPMWASFVMVPLKLALDWACPPRK